MVDSLAVILNVHRDSSTREDITGLFRSAGLQVWEAGTGSETLRRVSEGPGLIVLDSRLPDALALGRRIKSDPKTAQIPLLLSTENGQRDSEGAGRVEGVMAEAKLTLPINPPEWVATAKAWLRVGECLRSRQNATSHWQQIFDALSDRICLLNTQGQIVRANRAMADFLDRSETELLGANFLALTQHLFHSNQERPFERARKSGQREMVEWQAGERWIQISADPIFDASGAFCGVVEVLTDVTNQILLREQAAQFAAEAEAQVNRIEQLERDARSFQQFKVLQGNDDQGIVDESPLRLRDSEAFCQTVLSYENLLNQRLEQRGYQIKHDIAGGTRDLGRYLGRLEASPRDIVEAHSTALRRCCVGVPAAKVQAYTEEARILVLELMGRLAAHYRTRGRSGGSREIGGTS